MKKVRMLYRYDWEPGDPFAWRNGGKGLHQNNTLWARLTTSRQVVCYLVQQRRSTKEGCDDIPSCAVYYTRKNMRATPRLWQP